MHPGGLMSMGIVMLKEAKKKWSMTGFGDAVQ